MNKQNVRKANLDLATEEFMLPSDTPGIELYVRNKFGRGQKKFSGEKILLFVHGATYSSETIFDQSLGGTSMMEFVARHGYDVYLMDLRGYGKSTRPPEMFQPANQNRPIVQAKTATKDLAAVIKFILKRRQVSKLNLMAWSWGTSVAGWYASKNNSKVNKLILYAPLWLRSSPPRADTGGKLGSYRVVQLASAKKNWLDGVPKNKTKALIPKGWYDEWISAVKDEALQVDKLLGLRRKPETLHVPNGVLQDSRDFWSVNKPLYDPGKIKVPTLLVHAEWDTDLPSYMLRAYFAKLTHAPIKRCVEIGEGTHMVIMEKNRMQLFCEVQMFLDEKLKI